jgi:NhaA family Na+:H+ antiporter
VPGGGGRPAAAGEAEPAPAAHGGDAEPVIERILEPFRWFARVEAAGGLVLLVATALALGLANSSAADAYLSFWSVPVALRLGGWGFVTDLHHVVNDGLMAVFFFVVGLEIKRALIAGELASLQRAALPMLGAIGGMLVPAALDLAVAGRAAPSGWGVPMATDIAFALGILALLGDRVPTGLKLFLAALAIVDDIGAIVVIALFYSHGVAWAPLGAAAVILAATAGANRMGVRRPAVYAGLGTALWAAVLASGVHPTIAGVLLAAAIPVRTRLDESSFMTRARDALDDFDAAARVTAEDPETTILTNAGHHVALERLETLTEQAQPPLVRMEHALHGLVAFGIMPLFALANAGVRLDAGSLRRRARVHRSRPRGARQGRDSARFDRRGDRRHAHPPFGSARERGVGARPRAGADAIEP